MLAVPEGFKADANVYKTMDTYSGANIFLEKAELSTHYKANRRRFRSFDRGWTGAGIVYAGLPR